MKIPFKFPSVASLVITTAFFFCFGCVTTTVRETYTDAKGVVVQKETTTKAGDPAAWTLAGKAMDVAGQAMVVRQEKSGPITKEEIAERAKPINPTK